MPAIRSGATSRSTDSRRNSIIANRPRAMPVAGPAPGFVVASRARLGIDLGPAISGQLPIKLIGKIGEHDSRLGIEADLTALKLDNILPGWVKTSGKSQKATFTVVQKPQSIRFEDIVVDGGGVSIK